MFLVFSFSTVAPNYPVELWPRVTCCVWPLSFHYLIRSRSHHAPLILLTTALRLLHSSYFCLQPTYNSGKPQSTSVYYLFTIVEKSFNLDYSMKRGRSLDNGIGSGGGFNKKGKQTLKSLSPGVNETLNGIAGSHATCSCNVQYACCGISETNLVAVEQLLLVLGWICSNCKSNIKKLLGNGSPVVQDEIVTIK